LGNSFISVLVYWHTRWKKMYGQTYRRYATVQQKWAQVFRSVIFELRRADRENVSKWASTRDVARLSCGFLTRWKIPGVVRIISDPLRLQCCKSWTSPDLYNVKPKRFKSGEGAGHAVGATCLFRYSGKTLLTNSRTARRKCGGAPSWMNHKRILAWILPSCGSSRDVRWFETDVSRLPIGSSFKSQPRRRMNSIQPLRKPTISHVQRFVLNVWNDAQRQD
jgi:hypothetical protein